MSQNLGIRLSPIAGLLLFFSGLTFAAQSSGAAATALDPQYLIRAFAFSHFDSIFPAHVVERPTKAWSFQADPQQSPISYRFEGTQYSLDDYLARNPITGLLIVKDGQILAERYQYNRTEHDRLTSQSMSKTIVAMLMGIAVSEKLIHSVEDRAGTYLPELAGSEYGKTPLVDLLNMSSGMALDEGHLGRILTGSSSDEALRMAKEDTRVAPTGQKFAYSGLDDDLLALVLQRVTKQSLANYLSEKIWKPMGAEADASWVVDHGGHEIGFCCFNAVLRDYGRLGLLLANDGARNGRQIIPKEWILDATTVPESAPQLQPGASIPFFGYSYQTWIFPGPRRMFALLGAHGQFIMVDPASKLVMVQTAVFPTELDRQRTRETIALWFALVRQFAPAAQNG